MIEVVVPRESVNDESVIVQRVLVETGAVVDAGAAVVEIETSKTTVEIVAPSGGKIFHDLVVGEEVPVGALLFHVNDVGEENLQPSSAKHGSTSHADSAPDEQRPTPSKGTSALLSRAAAAMVAQSGLDLKGLSGRWVTTDDLRGQIDVSSGTTYCSADEMAEESAEGIWNGRKRSQRSIKIPYKEVVTSKRKRAEVHSLIGGMHAATTSCIGMRIRLPGERMVAEPALFREGISDLVMFEGARLLTQYPELNGFHLNERVNGHYDEVNFGISFDNGNNLKVLAIKSADKKELGNLQKEVLDLLELYESGRPIDSDVLESSTVTLSDLSSTGASYMLPLVNGRQSLMLGLVRWSRTEYDIFASFDHRLSEGLRVTRFLEQLRERVISHYRDESGQANVSCDICGKSMRDELRLGSRGFLKVVLPSGDEASMCRNCFEGR